MVCSSVKVWNPCDLVTALTPNTALTSEEVLGQATPNTDLTSPTHSLSCDFKGSAGGDVSSMLLLCDGTHQWKRRLWRGSMLIGLRLIGGLFALHVPALPVHSVRAAESDPSPQQLRPANGELLIEDEKPNSTIHASILESGPVALHRFHRGSPEIEEFRLHVDSDHKDPPQVILNCIVFESYCIELCCIVLYCIVLNGG